MVTGYKGNHFSMNEPCHIHNRHCGMPYFMIPACRLYIASLLFQVLSPAGDHAPVGLFFTLQSYYLLTGRQIRPHATHDIDMIVIVEKMTADFVEHF